MILRRIVGVVALALAAVPLPAAADEVEVGLSNGGSGAEIGSCGGFAPTYPNCTFAGTMPAVSTVHLSAQPEFTGRIGVVLRTQTGTYSASCDFLGALDPVCRSNTSGVLQIGQAFEAFATASAFNPADGKDLGGAAVGRWRVFITAP